MFNPLQDRTFHLYFLSILRILQKLPQKSQICQIFPTILRSSTIFLRFSPPHLQWQRLAPVFPKQLRLHRPRAPWRGQIRTQHRDFFAVFSPGIDEKFERKPLETMGNDSPNHSFNMFFKGRFSQRKQADFLGTW